MSDLILSTEQIDNFKEMENNCEDFFEFIDLGQEICSAGDKDWASDIFKKAEKIIGNFDDCMDLFKAVVDDDYLGNKEWGQKLISKAIQFAETSANTSLLLIEIGGVVHNNYYLGDYQKAKDIFKQGVKHAKNEDLFERSICYPLMDLADDIVIPKDDNGYGNKVWGKEIYDLALEKARLEAHSETCPFISADTFFPLRDFGL